MRFLHEVLVVAIERAANFWSAEVRQEDQKNQDFLNIAECHGSQPRILGMSVSRQDDLAIQQYYYEHPRTVCGETNSVVRNLGWNIYSTCGMILYLPTQK
jgi:hypothetical protein